MPPETPTTTVRPLSMDHLLLRELVVAVWHLAAQDALEGDRGHLARQGLAGALGPFVEPARLARGDDGQLVLVAARGRKQCCQFGHVVHPLVIAAAECDRRLPRQRGPSLLL